jgi:uncharacterized membrane protein
MNTGINTDDNNKKLQGPVKDSPTRSLLKALSWRIIATLTTFAISFITLRTQGKTDMQKAFEFAGYVSMADFVFKLVFYYLHERMWTNIKWGKYWRRSYWKRRRWKKIYRKMHKEVAVENTN